MELVRPAAYTEADVAEPMSSDDLSSFLDGFEEAGGTVRVLSEASWARFVTTIPEAGDDSEIYLTGDFQLADMSTAPIPEPSTYALLAAGLGVLAWRTRRRLRWRTWPLWTWARDVRSPQWSQRSVVRSSWT